MANQIKWLTIFVLVQIYSSAMANPVKTELSQKDKSLVKQQLQNDDSDRRKRSYYPWSGQIAPLQYESFTHWKPPTYQLSRPYYIPIYGAPGRIPVYYPPQPLLLNPGTPQDNPTFPRQNIYLHPFTTTRPGADSNFDGQSYLPPKTDKPAIEDKFGMDDDAPVWGGNNGQTDKTTTQRPSTMRPTRLPKPQSETLPPLLHVDTDKGTNQLSVDQPEVPPPEAPPRQGPSNCVWAIVNCCSVSNPRVVEACFEQRGCPGPFWGKSPCEGDFARAALENTLNYYNPDA